MLLLSLFAFLAGVVTILSPCILPVLPVLLSSSTLGGKKRPLGIVTGFVLSFTFFTLFLSLIVRVLGVPADLLRNLAIVIVFLAGLSLVIPQLQRLIEIAFSKLSQSRTGENRSGFWGGILIGMSLGLLWTPCVGPILAAVLSLALTGSVSGTSVIITLSYALGTAAPMLAILYGGQRVIVGIPVLSRNAGAIQRFFGLVMIVVSIAMALSLDRKFQTFVLTKFPQYGSGLTFFETNKTVEGQINRNLKPNPTESSKIGKPMFTTVESDLGNAPDLIPGGEWINLPAGKKSLSLKELRGKVVLVDFWTYTCINCIRTLPYLRAWNEKYSGKGLVIIGVHTPEFEFEKNINNVKKAVADFGLLYPVMQDNNYATWNAYANHYWPAKYFVDKNGKIRWSHFGEGNYDESEAMIQKLLGETGIDLGGERVNNPTYQIETQTPESYLGYGRIAYLVSPEEVKPNTLVQFTAPKGLSKNTFSFEGGWTLGEERAMPTEKSTLTFNFTAKNVFLVVRTNGGSGKARVYLDGKLIGQTEAGDDVKSSTVTVESDRLYNLVKLPGAGNHLLKLEFLDNKLELYAFTFG